MKLALSALLLAASMAGGAAHAAPAKAKAGSLPDARQALWEWRLGDAEGILRSWSQTDKRLAPEEIRERTLLRGRLDLQRGRFGRVISALTPFVHQNPEAWEARAVLGRALYATGDRVRGFEVLDAMADAYSNETLTAPADLVWLGVGLWLTDYPKNANQVLREALDAEPGLHHARVIWGELFIDKYNFRDSDALFLEVLQKRPQDPRALLGRAAIDILSDHKYSDAREKAEAVLAGSPECVPAHVLLARIELDNERPEAAAKRIEAHALKIAPQDPEALALLGAAYAIADDERGFRKAEKRALALNPRFARFYTTVSEHQARMHRYAEASKMDERALELDPEHWRAYVSLGIGLSRLGEDARAKEVLERAHDGDPYDVRTFNLLDRFYDRAIEGYRWVEAPPMRLRVHASEEAVFSRYMPGLLKEAWTHLTAKYGFVPEPPVHVEVFEDVELFAVRSIGLPRLAAHGICFGHVITARSPAAGNFNWAEVLWHELSHVFHIQLSKSRVPRWFTEGLAVYEATEGRPEWKREMDQTLFGWHRRGKLRGVADFNLAFTRAKSMEDILVAYYHAYRMAEFIATEYGNKRMKKMLLLWGDKEKTPQVFAKALRVKDLADFDARFSSWLDAELAHLAGDLRLGARELSEQAESLEKAAELAPKDKEAQVKAAIAWLGKGEGERAQGRAEAALALDDEEPRALAVRGLAHAAEKRWKPARADLEAVLATGADGFELRTTLSTICKALGDRAGAAQHLEAAIGRDPQAGSHYHALVELLDGLGREADAYQWRKKAALVDQGSMKLVSALLDGAEVQGASKDEVLHWGELGNHIAPLDADHHARFARQLLRLGEPGLARFEADTALLIAPEHAQAKEILAALEP